MRTAPPPLALLLALAFCLALGGGCFHYAVHSSSSSESAGWGGGGGAGAAGESGSVTGSGPGGYDYPIADRRPAPQRPGMIWDAALGLYRVEGGPATFFDGTAYYRQDGHGGWLASYERHGPWLPVTEDVIPPILRRR